MTTIVPLHPDDGPIWTDADSLAATSELMNVEVFPVGNFFYWKINHPNLTNNRAGPFKSATDAYANLMGWDKEDDTPFEMPDIVAEKISEGRVDNLANKIIAKMLDSNDPAEQAKARELIEKYSYD